MTVTTQAFETVYTPFTDISGTIALSASYAHGGSKSLKLSQAGTDSAITATFSPMLKKFSCYVLVDDISDGHCEIMWNETDDRGLFSAVIFQDTITMTGGHSSNHVHIAKDTWYYLEMVIDWANNKCSGAIDGAWIIVNDDLLITPDVPDGTLKIDIYNYTGHVTNLFIDDARMETITQEELIIAHIRDTWDDDVLPSPARFTTSRLPTTLHDCIKIKELFKDEIDKCPGYIRIRAACWLFVSCRDAGAGEYVREILKSYAFEAPVPNIKIDDLGFYNNFYEFQLTFEHYYHEART